MSASALTLDSIVRRYADAPRPALDGLSLALEAGELLALVGASGAGKTTTLRIAAGYDRPDAGTVSLDGVDITALPPERRDVGMVFQHYALFPHLSVEDNVAFGLRARGVARAERRARARRALADVGLDGTARRDVRALSGGEQQRVALARALVIEPRVLLLDEPLSNLDPTLRITMREELRATLRRSHVTALFVTHDQDDAFAVADRVALLHDGAVLQVDTPEALYDRPASRPVAEFIGRATLVATTLDGDGARIALGGLVQRVATSIRCNAQLQRDGAWLAVLRPESIVLEAADAPGTWAGRVVARHFAGGGIVCRIAIAEGPVVETFTTHRALCVGDHVGVRVVGPVAVVPGAARDPRPQEAHDE